MDHLLYPDDAVYFTDSNCVGRQAWGPKGTRGKFARDGQAISKNIIFLMTVQPLNII